MEFWIPERSDGKVAQPVYFVYGNSAADADLQLATSNPALTYMAWISQIAGYVTSNKVQVHLPVSDTLVLHGTLDPNLDITYCSCVAPTDLTQPLTGPTAEMGLFVLFKRQRLGGLRAIIGVLVVWVDPTTPATGLGPQVVKVELPG